ncbi:iron ABC transporter permease [Helicobacter sp. MIT 21-1697]|uniref:FecCD family ABC transporter permease n=1 Tax=Helicobacter sp. MIT 21-1697 TaxID=2993733 RepID=UPI00224B1039|nr:iron ABC transporter permease [Helicobacter sp. MIT 21-1697]MCX2717906.1 iron ABC transporter permease [Helicobacter sp. MIT 21-1697]
MTSFKSASIYIVALSAVLLCAIFSLSVGRYTLSIGEVIASLMGEGDEIQTHIIFSFRLPRVLLAIVVGAGLSVAGVAFQSLFRNPLATPDILGVTSGASFGAVLGLLLGLSMSYIGIIGFMCGIASLALVVLIGYNKHIPYETTTMILSGVIISAFFQSLIGIVKYIADPQDTLPTITYWLLGSLDVNVQAHTLFSALGILLGMLILFIVRWKCNALMLPDDEAKSLGINLNSLRCAVIFASTMIVTCAVSICGVIGWIGLLVPHIARLLIGNENSKLIPLSIIIGALFLLLIDTLSRTLSSEQIPISILTSLVGVPFFIYILRKNARR